MDEAALTDALAQLGLPRDGGRAVALLPLVEVAWADGRIQAAELRILHEVAAGYGLRPGDPFLARWLGKRPPRTAFLQARAVLVALWQRAEGELEADPLPDLDALMARCLEVAEAAGGLFGVLFTVEASERAVMAEIAQSLQTGPALPPSAGTPRPAARRAAPEAPTPQDAPSGDGAALLEDATLRRPPSDRARGRTPAPAPDAPTLTRRPPGADALLGVPGRGPSPSAAPTAALDRPPSTRATPAPAPGRLPFDPNATLLRETPVMLGRDRRAAPAPPPEVDTERMVRPTLDSPTLVPHGTGRDEYLAELDGLDADDLTTPYVDEAPDGLPGRLEDEDR